MKGAEADLAIVGGGPAGLAAAAEAFRLGLRPLVLEQAREPGGQLREIENLIKDLPGPSPCTAGELQARLLAGLPDPARWLASSCTVRAWRPGERGHPGTLELDQDILPARWVLCCSGAVPRRLGVPGEDRLAPVSASRDAERFRGQPVVVVGGGDRAAEGALRMARAGAQVLWLHRSRRFRARPHLLREARARPEVKLCTGARVLGLLHEPPGVSVCWRDGAGRERRNEAAAVLIRIGRAPATGWLPPEVRRDAQGYLLVGRGGTTSLPGLLAAGDACTPPPYAGLAASLGQAVSAVRHVAYARR